MPAKNGLVDLLIGVNYADLHYAFVNICGNLGESIAHLGLLEWICIGPDLMVEHSLEQEHTIRAFLIKDTGLTWWNWWLLSAGSSTQVFFGD